LSPGTHTAAGLLLVALGLALAIHAGASTPGSDDPEAQRAHWQKRAEAVRERHRAALTRYQAAATAYETHRRNNRRGETKEAIIAERDAAGEELDQAQRELDAFPDEARRAGALPGWLRPPPGSNP
jgi:hypothetical protein